MSDDTRAEAEAAAKSLDRIDGGTGPVSAAREGSRVIRALLAARPEPARKVRECVFCGEKVPMSHATESWERQHASMSSEAHQTLDANVRKALARLLAIGDPGISTEFDMADAILARFKVVPR